MAGDDTVLVITSDGYCRPIPKAPAESDISLLALYCGRARSDCASDHGRARASPERSLASAVGNNARHMFELNCRVMNSEIAQARR